MQALIASSVICANEAAGTLQVWSYQRQNWFNGGRCFSLTHFHQLSHNVIAHVSCVSLEVCITTFELRINLNFIYFESKSLEIIWEQNIYNGDLYLENYAMEPSLKVISQKFMKRVNKFFSVLQIDILEDIVAFSDTGQSQCQKLKCMLIRDADCHLNWLHYRRWIFD